MGYQRLSKSGPDQKTQDAALSAQGVVLDLGLSLFLDPLPKRGRQASFAERDLAIRALRPGDVLVIHSAPVLGTTEPELRAAAAAISKQGAALYDCAENMEVRFHPDAGLLLEWAKAGAAKAAAERLGKARRSITKHYTPPKALSGKALGAAKARWEARAESGESVAAIAKSFDVSPRTLYREAKEGKWRMPE